MYPSSFYYKTTISACGFQKEVSSQFDIQRLLQHRSDIWVAPKPKVRNMRKHIVFDHILITNLSFKFRPNLIQLINEMIDDGFSTYYECASRSYQFEKGLVGEQIERFFSLSHTTFDDEKSYLTINKKEIYRLNSVILCFKLFKNDLIPEITSKLSFFYKTDPESYNYIINNKLILSSKTSTQGGTHKIIHRIENLCFENIIPEQFYSADLSSLFQIKLINISLDSDLIAFLNSLPIQELHLIFCSFDSIDFLNDKIKYLTIEGDVSSNLQKKLLGRIEQLKALHLVVEQPDPSVVDEITSFYPNIAKLETNLPLGLVLSKFPNLIEFVYKKTPAQDETPIETGLSAQTNPRLKVFTSDNDNDSDSDSDNDSDSDSYYWNDEPIIYADKDKNLFQLYLAFPHLANNRLSISSSSLQDLSTPLSKVIDLEIIIKESFSFDEIRQMLELFPSCKDLVLKSKNQWRIVPSLIKDCFKNFKNSIINLKCINLYLEEKSADIFVDLFSSIKNLSLTRCVFENNALNLFFKPGQMAFTSLEFKTCRKNIVLHDDTSAVNFTFEDLYSALKSSMEVRQLYLDELDIDKVLHPHEAAPLENIKFLFISLSHVDHEVFAELIRVLPSLQTLRLSEGAPKSDFYFIPPDSLISLQTFEANCKLSKKQKEVFANARGISDKYEDKIDDKINDESDDSVISELLFDPDTECHSDRNFYLCRYFWDISSTTAVPLEADLYRIDILDKVNLQEEPVPLNMVCSLTSTTVDQSVLDQCIIDVEEINTVELVKEKYKRNGEAEGLLVMGKYNIPSCQHWVPLPSFKARENMVGYHVIDDHCSDDKDDKKNLVQFSYSSENNLHYVKASKRITIAYYLVVLPSKALSMPLPDEIEKTIMFLKNFKPSNVKPALQLTTIDYYNFVVTHRTGSCRIRAFLFKVWMERYFNEFPVRIVTNECHAFVEIYFDNQWIDINLGGYPAQLTYMNETPVQSITPPTPYDTTIARRQYFKNLMKDSSHHKNNHLEDIIKLSPFESKKILVECRNNETFMALPYALQNYLKSSDTPYCYIHYPESLDCQHPTLAINEDFTGYFTEEPHSHLYQFLKKGEGVLIINYTHFSAEQFAQFNDILDDVRQIKGLPISPHISVIGLINTTRHDMPGSDFYSRFNEVTFYDGPEKIDDESLFRSIDLEEVAYINLYESEDWESMLIGQWLPSLSGFTFQKGLLTAACLNGHQAIHIQNGPWHLESFCHFWRQTKVDGYFCYADRKVDMNSIVLTRSQGYAETLVPRTETETEIYVLSEHTYGFFFQNFQVHDGSLVSLPGFIEQTPNILSILITEPISKPQWMRFLDAVNTKGIQLNISVAPDVTCEFLDDSMKRQSLHLSRTQLIHTNDIDGYLSQARDEVIIDISECNASDLVSSIQIEFQASGTPFVFSMRKGFIEQCLEQGKSVVLKGDFRADLVYGLLPFLLEDNANVSLVFEDTSSLAFFKVDYRPIDKQALLKQNLSLENLPWFIKLEESYAKCMARYHYWERTGDEHTEHNWQGLLELEAENKMPDELDAKTIIIERRAKIDSALTREPYVFISGLSGVGKTTFIKENLLKADEQLFVGQEQLLDWLIANANDRMFLFLDEANLSPTQWSMFEGLFLPRPALFYQEKYYHLSTQHKVIFAGNPISYGGERELCGLFKKYGNAIVFRPLSVGFIKEVVLKPILQKNPWVVNQISSIYIYLCQHSTDEILVTPRELKTLALFSKINYLNIPNQLTKLFHLNAQLFLKNRLPKEKTKSILSAMELNETKHSSDDLLSAIKWGQTNIKWGQTHCEALYMMQQFLNLHLYRKSDPSLKDEEKFGGLSGLILEGSPGLGKTKMVEMMLQSNNIHQHIRIPASSSLANKRNMLYQAFNEGHVVWIDEFNSGPLLEQELNAYLSGYDLNGHRPSCPGFLLIATQNPSSMLGRRNLSPALLQRVVVFEISEYTSTEMIKILEREGISQEDAACFVSEYKHQHVKYNFRDFLKFANMAFKNKNEELRGEKRCLELSSSSIFAPCKQYKREDRNEPMREKRQRDEATPPSSPREKIVRTCASGESVMTRVC